ncbi:MAG: cytochrome c peroxidase [Polyangiales bacterium]
MTTPTHTFLAVFFALLVVACGATESEFGGAGGAFGGAEGAGGNGGEGPVAAPSLPWPLTAFPELPEIARNVPEDRIALGRLLFFDPILSIDDQVACATCHSEFWGMSDAIRVGVGHGAGLIAGPGRDGPNLSRRNSLSLFNLAFRETLLWDGRSSSLEEQALLPLLAEEEFNIDPGAALERISAVSEYVELFAAAFPDAPHVTADNLASAISAFERTFVSDRALYDAYAAGEPGTFDEDLVEGMFRFAHFGCDGCHTPPLFESEVFANRHVPSVNGVVDFGLAEITKDPDDVGKFRTPSLRNSYVTEPYFHNGSVGGLKDAVEHELEESGMPFDERDLFLVEGFVSRALRDTSRGAQRPRSVPSGLPLPLDAER